MRIAKYDYAIDASSTHDFALADRRAGSNSHASTCVTARETDCAIYCTLLWIACALLALCSFEQETRKNGNDPEHRHSMGHGSGKSRDSYRIKFMHPRTPSGNASTRHAYKRVPIQMHTDQRGLSCGTNRKVRILARVREVRQGPANRSPVSVFAERRRAVSPASAHCRAPVFSYFRQPCLCVHVCVCACKCVPNGIVLLCEFGDLCERAHARVVNAI